MVKLKYKYDRGMLMEIGDIRIRLVQKLTGALRAIASFTIDECFVVHDVKIFERDGEHYIAMPNRRSSTGEYLDIVHPINTETRELIRSALLAQYFRLQQS